MEAVTSITSQPIQNFILKLDTNETISFKLYFYSSQNAWYYDFEYKDYVSQGNKVVIALNAIRHLRNILPFGFGFTADTNADPFNLDSFVNKDCIMILLNKDDVQMLEETVYAPQ